MRADSPFDSSYILNLASRAKVKTVTVTARCEHGRTRNQTCRQCDNGYVEDVHSFYEPHGDVAYSSLHECALAGLSADGGFVRYIPKRYEARANAMESFYAAT